MCSHVLSCPAMQPCIGIIASMVLRDSHLDAKYVHYGRLRESSEHFATQESIIVVLLSGQDTSGTARV